MYLRGHSLPAPDFTLPWEISVATSNPLFPYHVMNSNGALDIDPANLTFGLGYPGESFSAPNSHNFEPAIDEEPKCIVFVHGIDLTIPTQLGYGESFYKRLWWEGYRGRFVAFRWNTVLDDSGGFLMPGRENLSIFNSGEYRSFKAGASLRKFVDSEVRTMFGGKPDISVVAHSLGNACASEALKQGMIAKTYIAMEAAVSMSAYFPQPSDPLYNPQVRPAPEVDLVDADLACPTPEFAIDGGWGGYFSDINTRSGAKCFAYQNEDDFWLTKGTTYGIVPIPPVPLQSLPFDLWPRVPLAIPVNWIFNAKHAKPDDRIGAGEYTYENSTPSLSLTWVVPANNPAGFETRYFLRSVADGHEIMSFISRPQTRALGNPANGDPACPPCFEECYDMKGMYGFGKGRADHSGQYQRDIRLMYGNESGIQWKVPFSQASHRAGTADARRWCSACGGLTREEGLS